MRATTISLRDATLTSASVMGSSSPAITMQMQSFIPSTTTATAMSKQMEEPMTQMPVSHATTAVVPSSSTVSTTIVSAQMPTNVDDTLIGAIVGGIAGLLVIVAAIAWCVVIDRRRRLAPDRDHGHAMSDVRDAGPVYSSVRPVSNIYDDVDGVRAQQM
jgi:hypothetical protein